MRLGQRQLATKNPNTDRKRSACACMAESRLSTKQQVKSIWDLGGLTPSQLAKRVWFEIGHDNLFSVSSVLAYNSLLGIFPMPLLLVALLGVFAAQRKQSTEQSFLLLFPGTATGSLSVGLPNVERDRKEQWRRKINSRNCACSLVGRWWYEFADVGP